MIQPAIVVTPTVRDREDQMTTTPATSADETERLRERVTELKTTLARVDSQRQDAVKRASRRDE